MNHPPLPARLLLCLVLAAVGCTLMASHSLGSAQDMAGPARIDASSEVVEGLAPRCSVGESETTEAADPVDEADTDLVSKAWSCEMMICSAYLLAALLYASISILHVRARRRHHANWSETFSACSHELVMAALYGVITFAHVQMVLIHH